MYKWLVHLLFHVDRETPSQEIFKLLDSNSSTTKLLVMAFRRKRRGGSRRSRGRRSRGRRSTSYTVSRGGIRL